MAGCPNRLTFLTPVRFTVAVSISSTKATWLKLKPASATPWRFGAKSKNDLDVAISALANTLRRQQKFSEAEPLFRECLAMRETNCPNAWYTFFTRLRLGATLMGKRNYDEAEPLIISGYEGMRQREAGIRDPE